MISRADITRSLNAVWLLFLDRAGAIQLFDAGVDGFWKSFQAIVLVAPIYAFSVAADVAAYLAVAEPGSTFDATAYFISHALTLALDWVTLPVLLALLAGPLGIRGGYSVYIVARNWSSVFTIVPYAVVSLLELTGLFPGLLLLFPAGVAFAIALRLSYVGARRGLGVPVDVAIGFVALDFLVSLGLAQAMAYLFGVDVS
jgi:hypothetical protein